MSPSERDRLRSIRTFPSLVKYLRDDLEWPIESDDFDELTFDYTADELGIDPKTAAKIQDIKQLRPPPGEPPPWGIFFIKFEPKRLPVVALRRILGALAIRKRASANAAERAAFAKDDLLFISNYGEGDERQITFAHFTEDEQAGDLPTLKVLGWDQEDTALHLDDVHGTLTGKLRWPDDPRDVKHWRETWSSAFVLRPREVITTSRDLALRLADLARDIRKRVNAALRIETEKGPLRRLMKAFQAALIHDLDEDGFADMYAQTIAYGLLSARVSRPAGLTADNLAEMVPITNPFLKELMETFLHLGGRRRNGRNGTGIDFDELGINEVVELLRDANMEAVLRDFGNLRREEDPVIHFYELFLKEYDANKQMKRGVFYTPKPVVSYIVRSVHELLQTEFGLEDGLASTVTWAEMAKRHAGLKIPDGVPPDSPFVQILDPATGTATFLVEVIDVIHKTMVARWKKQGHTEMYDIPKLWNEYVPNHLLPRLHGYELLMAPYAIAHMKLGLKLYETGYTFGGDERARIYLTNALEPPQDFSGTFEQMAPALAHEAQAVNDVKRDQRFTVVLGNPPYSGHSANQGEWIQSLLRSDLPDACQGYFEVDGAPLNERNPKWLNDDYVKFIRYAQYCLAQSKTGVLGFITNHGYYDNPTFRGMRQSLLRSFSIAYLIDLHGNVKKASADVSDENVFDIQQGVGISVWARPPVIGPCRTRYASRMGDRAKKCSWLLTETALASDGTEICPVAPFYLLVPQRAGLRDEFNSGWPLPCVFPVNTMGVTTGRDQLCVSFTQVEAIHKLNDFTSNTPESELAARYGLSNKSGWSIAKARKLVRAAKVSKARCHSFAYRPFDARIIYLDAAIVGRPRSEVMKHMQGPKNIGLCTTRQVNGQFRHVFCTGSLANDCLVSLASGERTYLFPLYLHVTEGELLSGSDVQHNVSEEFVKVLMDRVEVRQGSRRGFGAGMTPESVFTYVYSVLHSPEYRRRYSDLLRIEFPRIPVPSGLDLFRQLAMLGDELVALHLMEFQVSKRDEAKRRYPQLIEYTGGKAEVEKVSWAKNTVWLDKAQTYGFKGVPQDVWNFHIGGYQVCEKWLKDRKGRVLSKADIEHYQKIVVALNETIRIMAEIDKVIDHHGGWPGAFITDPKVLEGLRSPKA